jgi:hypothetical protein
MRLSTDRCGGGPADWRLTAAQSERWRHPYGRRSEPHRSTRTRQTGVAWSRGRRPGHFRSGWRRRKRQGSCGQGCGLRLVSGSCGGDFRPCLTIGSCWPCRRALKTARSVTAIMNSCPTGRTPRIRSVPGSSRFRATMPTTSAGTEGFGYWKRKHEVLGIVAWATVARRRGRLAPAHVCCPKPIRERRGAARLRRQVQASRYSSFWPSWTAGGSRGSPSRGLPVVTDWLRWLSRWSSWREVAADPGLLSSRNLPPLAFDVRHCRAT